MDIVAARELQEILRTHVRIEPLTHMPRTIAGIDVSCRRGIPKLYAAICVFSFPDLVLKEEACAHVTETFPYIPGYLSFRELPAIAAAYAKLSVRPELCMFDGQGIAHPRRLGIASHFGVTYGVPTIGVAKRLLYGKGELPIVVGKTKPVRDPSNDELLGYRLLSKHRTKPLIISPGHLISADESVALVRACLTTYRLPLPTKTAHERVNVYRLSPQTRAS